MRRIAIVMGVLMIGGCVTPHRDVLLFGTDTSLGVNVGADPASAQVTQVSIGYKRREAVYMPLVINAADSALVCANTPTSSDKQCTQTERIAVANPSEIIYSGSGEGSATGGKDTYSVFASFGGEANGGTGSAKAAVAQFFATGIAAQRLSARPQAVQLISTEAPKAAEAAAIAKLEGFTEATQLERERTSTLKTQEDERITAIESFVFGAPDAATRSTRLQQISNIDLLSDNAKASLRSATTPAELRARLRSDEITNFVAEIHTKLPIPPVAPAAPPPPAAPVAGGAT